MSALLSELDEAGTCKNSVRVLELWNHATLQNYVVDNQCSRAFLHWFSTLGEVRHTLDVISSLIPNVTTHDTLQLLQSYQNAKDHKTAQFALQLLMDNAFELKREHFDVLISTAASNGDLDAVLNVFETMRTYQVAPTSQTLSLIFACLDTHFEAHKFSLAHIDIDGVVKHIQKHILPHISDDDDDYADGGGDGSNSSMSMDDVQVMFMRWYCQFGDVQHASMLYEDISFQSHALKSGIMEKLAVQQISLLFKHRINLSKAISLLQQVLDIYDDSLYAFFQQHEHEQKRQIVPSPDTARRLFAMLISMQSTNWCHVNVLNFLLHLCCLSGDVHNAFYILHQWYLKAGEGTSNPSSYVDYVEQQQTSAAAATSGAGADRWTLKMRAIQPDHFTIHCISRIFEMVSSSQHCQHTQPKTIDWSVQIYEWLLHKYQGHAVMRDVLTTTTHHLLRLLLLTGGTDMDNIQRFVDVLHAIKNVIAEFETDGSIFSLLGELTVGDETQISAVTEKTIRIYACMVDTRDGTTNSRKITSVTDRTLLLGSILAHYDDNICKLYRDQIGGLNQSSFQIRRDLQQQLVMELHRRHSLRDILTLDVLKITDRKPTTFTTALTEHVTDVTL